MKNRLAVLIALAASAAWSQNLNWEGQTGGFVTPFAYTAPSGAGVGKPVVSFHYLDAGPVIGGYYQASVTAGFFRRAEFGYTRAFHSASGEILGNLWNGGFNTVHGKVNLVAENAGSYRWVPAISAGFVIRSQVRNVGGVLSRRDTHNGDAYFAATKTVTQVKGLPLVFNAGFKGTNASLLGLAGNAPAFQGRLFGAAAFVLKGPSRSAVILGSEISQQPRRVEGLGGAALPSTVTYFTRIVPRLERAKLNVDLGVGQVAGEIMPGVSLSARHQFATGVSYQF